MRLLGVVGVLLVLAGAAQANCTLETVARLPAKIDDEGRIFIPGTMDGHPVDYLVDLAALTTLLRIPAERFSITPVGNGNLDKIASFGEPGGDQFMVQNLPLRIAGSAEDFGEPREIALLGMDFFGRYDVEFDVQHGKIVLYRPSNCAATELAYWPGPHSVADMVANTAHSNIPPLNSYNFPHINIRLEVAGQDTLAAIDSGYSLSSIGLGTGYSMNLVLDGPGTIETKPTADLLDGFTTLTWVGTVHAVKLGEETIAPARLNFRSFVMPPGVTESPTGSRVPHVRYDGDDMMLGADFIIAHRLFISQSQKKIYFSPAENASFLGGRPRAGLD